MIETMETVPAAAAADVANCPFCGARPYWLGVVYRGPNGRVEPHFYHPGVVTDKDCVLSGRGYSLAGVTAWNTRPAAQPNGDAVERVERQIIDAIEAQFDIHAMEPEDWAEMSSAIHRALASLPADQGAARRTEEIISAWAFAHDIDGAARNDLFARLRAGDQGETAK